MGEKKTVKKEGKLSLMRVTDKNEKRSSQPSIGSNKRKSLFFQDTGQSIILRMFLFSFYFFSKQKKKVQRE